MVIGIDARENQSGVFTGIGRVLEVFLDYFQNLTDDNRIILFSAKPIHVYSSNRISNIVKKEHITFYWDQVVLVQLIREYKVDVFYSPYYKVPVFCPCPVISAIFDLMYIYFEPYRKAMPFTSRLYYRTIGTIMAKKANMILTCSEFSKNDIVRYYRVIPEKVKVVYLGLDAAYKPVMDIHRIEKVKHKYNIDGDYVLYSGNVKVHKNVETLLESFRMVCTEIPHVKLVLATAKDKQFRRIEQLIDNKTMIVTGKVPIEDQVALYSGAKIFVITSLYEGFGFPPLEAMACGTPVISSHSGSLPEIVGEGGIIVDGLDARAIAEKMKEVIGSNLIQKKMKQAGIKRSEEFSQEKYACSLYSFLLRYSG